MHPALLKLLAFSIKSGFRRTFRGARTLKGFCLIVFAVGTMALTIAPSLVMATTMRGRPDVPQFGGWVQPYLPLMLLAVTIAIVSGAASDAAIAFTPAEIDFLFPAPFKRRELLVYKLAKLFLGSLLTACFLSISCMLFLGPWLSAFVGIFLTLIFINLIAIVLALARQIVAEQAYTLTRKVVVAVVGTLAAVGVAQVLLQTSLGDISSLATRFRATGTGRVILAPFEVFGHAIMAPSVVPDLLGWGAAAAAIDFGLLMLVFKLDVDYLEAAAAISQKLYERMQKARKGGGFATSSSAVAARLPIPVLPWLGGAGPLAWRQLLIAIRTSRFLVVFTAVCAIGILVLAFFLSRGNEKAAMITPAVGLSFVSYTTFLFSMQLPFAFRGDIDHIDYLKTLPVRRLALAGGQLTGGVVVLAAVQIIVLAAVIIGKGDPRIVMTGGAFLLPLDVIMLGVSNFLFLLYPVRMGPSNSADFQLMARLMLLMLLQFLILILCVGIPAALGAIVFFASNLGLTASAVTAWLALVAELPFVVLAVSWAFERFDPSVDTPV